MARNTSPGISFYRMDSGHIQNKKVRLLFNDKGSDGYYIWSSILDYAYKNYGYYFPIHDQEELELFASEYCKMSLEKIQEVIECCMKRKLFDQGVFDRAKVLTSEMMQDIFIHATSDRRKKKSVFEMEEDWLLLDFNGTIPGNIVLLPGNNSEKQQQNAQNEGNIPQTRQDKTREEKTREEGTKKMAPEVPAPQEEILTEPKKEEQEKKGLPRAKFSKPTFEELKAYFINRAGNVQNAGPAYWPEDKCHNEATKMMDFYTENGWKQGKGKAIVDWQATTRKWIRRAIEDTAQGHRYPAPSPNYPAGTNQAHPGPEIKQPIRITKHQIEINYFFDRYKEDSNQVTVISIETEHYNTLKSAGLVNFEAGTVNEIQEAARKYITEHSLEDSEVNMVRYMKKIGVLKFFEQNKNQTTDIFHEK